MSGQLADCDLPRLSREAGLQQASTVEYIGTISRHQVVWKVGFLFFLHSVLLFFGNRRFLDALLCRMFGFRIGCQRRFVQENYISFAVTMVAVHLERRNNFERLAAVLL